MKKNFFTSAGCLALVVLLSTALISFTKPFGGDFIRVYLDNKLVIEQFLHMEKGVKSLTLQPTHKAGKLKVQYSHCGVAGKSRELIMRDAQNKEIRKWKYADGSEKDLSMNLQVKEILDAAKNKSKINLYYSSREIPKGKQVLSLELESATVARK